MHSLDLKEVASSVYEVIVKLIPLCYGDDLWPGKVGYGGEIETINDQAEDVKGTCSKDGKGCEQSAISR